MVKGAQSYIPTSQLNVVVKNNREISQSTQTGATSLANEELYLCLSIELDICHEQSTQLFFQMWILTATNAVPSFTGE